jgi:diguanylate cyclase (GGDEF)-like protein/PAS domain S-box-containing protein
MPIDESAKPDSQPQAQTPTARLDFAEYLLEIVAKYDQGFRHTYVNRAVEGMTGLSRASFLGKSYRELGMPEELVRNWEKLMGDVFRSGQPGEINFPFKSPSGLRQYTSFLVPQVSPSGQVEAVLSVARDVTDLTTANGHILASHYKAIVDSSDDAIISKTLDGTVTSWNRGAEKIFGYTEAEMLGQPLLVLFPPEKINEEQFILEKLIEGEKVDHFETVRISKDGRRVDVSVTISPIRNEYGEIIGASKVARDITLANQQHERLQMTLDVACDGLWDWDLRTGTIYRTSKYYEVTGYSPEEDTHDFGFFVRTVHPEDLSNALRVIEAHRRGETEQIEFEYRLVSKTGETGRWILSKGRAIERDPAGHALRILGTLTDITTRKVFGMAHEAELDRVAHYDPLTGVPNRRLLADRLEQAILRANRSGKSLAVCYLDLDGFKQINDQHGHATGDQVLISVAEQIKRVLRVEDTLSRLGGDEFVMLLADITSPQECSLILERILQAISQPVFIDGHRVSVSASIGVSQYPEDHVDADTLLRHADQAMYFAKDSGKNRYHLFDPGNDRKVQAHRQSLVRLREALAHEEFILYYQPKVDLTNGDLMGVEALIRWQDPRRGVLSPAEFLPQIHGSSLEQPLGEWVIRAALKQITQWCQSGLDLPVSINISAAHLMQANFVERLKDILIDFPEVPRGFLEMEILETAAMGDIEHGIQVLNQCRELGIEFALDDFGTGYSSLTYLRKLPVDLLKIDQSFVRDMLHDSEARGIVEGVIRMANAFKRRVIAEGVETLEHGKVLLSLGCSLVQGYGIARPMSSEQVQTWVQTWRANRQWKLS